MKKILAVLLTIAIFAGLVLPTLAFQEVSDCPMPVIQIAGDSKPIYDEDGNLVYSTKKVLEVFQNMTAGQSKDEIIKTIASKMTYILSAYYIQGCFFQDFSEYYERIYETVSPLFEKARLDENGNVTNGTGLDKDTIAEMEASAVDTSTNFNTVNRRFFYDWRLDPLEVADDLKEYIDSVKKSTGYDKVGILCRCVGANILLAYVAKYGTDDICGVALDGVAVNGCEILTEPVAGKFAFDANAINRTLYDLKATGKANISPKITSAIDFADKSGVVDFIKFCIKFPNYNRMLKGITSSMALATFYTWPNYWACFSSNDYETGLEYVFGSEGSENRVKYAGLIEKLDNYDKLVRQNLPELMNEINDNCNLVIISKYGMQCSPITESKDKIGDQLISVNYSSFGATTGTIFEPLSDEYIANQTAKGLGKYISPDKYVDASTCQFPDQTFFVKGASHSDWTQFESDLCVLAVCADHQITIDEYPDYQFTVFDYETYSTTKMTTENCNTENWTVDNSERNFDPVNAVEAYARSVKNLVNAFK